MQMFSPCFACIANPVSQKIFSSAFPEKLSGNFTEFQPSSLCYILKQFPYHMHRWESILWLLVAFSECIEKTLLFFHLSHIICDVLLDVITFSTVILLTHIISILLHVIN